MCVLGVRAHARASMCCAWFTHHVPLGHHVMALCLAGLWVPRLPILGSYLDPP